MKLLFLSTRAHKTKKHNKTNSKLHFKILHGHVHIKLNKYVTHDKRTKRHPEKKQETYRSQNTSSPH